MQDFDIEARFKDVYSNGFTHEETRELFIQYQQDKLNGIKLENITARTLLITANLKLINFVIVEKLKRGYCDMDGEEYSIGKIGLINAVDKFDINKNMKFSSFAVKVILNSILMYHRNENTEKKRVNRIAISLEEYLKEGEDMGSLSRTKCLMDEYDFRDDIVFEDDCNQIFSSLKHFSPQDQYLIVSHFGLYSNPIKSHREIGLALGVSRSEITRRYSIIANKLKLLLSLPCDLNAEQQYLRRKLLQQEYPLIDEIFKYRDEGNISNKIN